MNWIRFRNSLFGFRIEINEHGRVQFETNELFQMIDVGDNKRILGFNSTCSQCRRL